jgi:hypothetical protein
MESFEPMGQEDSRIEIMYRNSRERETIRLDPGQRGHGGADLRMIERWLQALHVRGLASLGLRLDLSQETFAMSSRKFVRLVRSKMFFRGKSKCPRRESNPHGDFSPRDFKSRMSAIPSLGQ